MNIIPVIDLKDGLVVCAQQGQRETYTPINSKLCNSSAIEDVIDCYLSIYPFENIYIADLNAITRKCTNEKLINTMINKYPMIEFWVDCGENIKNLSAIPDINYRPIIGSESQKTITNFDVKLPFNNYILSLDFFPKQGYLGPIELINDPKLWPEDIIIMTLDKVGKKSGPDFERLKCFQQKAADKNFIAAGGIRDLEDLMRLKKMGINHALVASALHSGEINQQTIKKLISAT